MFSVLTIMLGFGLCCCVLGVIKAIALSISQNLGFDAILNVYTKINSFIYNGRSAFGYVFNILSSVIAIILCAVAGHLWLRDFSKKEIAGACTIYNIYTILTLLITYPVYHFILTGDFYTHYSSFYPNIIISICNIISIGRVMADSITSVVVDTMDIMWPKDRFGDQYHMYVKITFVVKYVVQLVLPYLLMLFGKSEKSSTHSKSIQN